MHRTEVCHVGLRGLGQKSSDRDTLPFCAIHHREGRYSQHHMGKRFWEYWKIDKQNTIAELNRIYDNLNPLIIEGIKHA
jgi:hypothetical protein